MLHEFIFPVRPIIQNCVTSTIFARRHYKCTFLTEGNELQDRDSVQAKCTWNTFSRNTNKESVSYVVCYKWRTDDMLDITYVAEQHCVIRRRRLPWMQLQNHFLFTAPFFFLWKFCLHCFINAFAISSLLRNHTKDFYSGTTWSSFLLYNHTISNTNVIWFNFERRDSSRSSHWTREL